MKRKKRSDKYSIDTGGGAFIGGNIDTRGGDFVGRDKIVENYVGPDLLREPRKRSGGSGRRRQARIEELQKQWDLLGEKLHALEKQHTLETRAEEKLRLKRMIDEAWAERDRIEQALDRLEGRG